MGRALRWVGLGVVFLAGVATLGLGYLLLAYPVMPTPEQGAVAVDADKLARGAYLAERGDGRAAQRKAAQVPVLPQR